jgi:hypothetical protein
MLPENPTYYLSPNWGSLRDDHGKHVAPWNIREKCALTPFKETMLRADPLLPGKQQRLPHSG